MQAMAKTFSGAARDLESLRRYSHLLSNLVVHDLKVRYKRSVIGFLWTLINPILMTIVFTVVFSTLFKSSVKDYIIYFLAGWLLWNFFAESTSASASCILASGGLFKQIYVPKIVFVIAMVGSKLINFFLALAVLFALMIVIGSPFNAAMLFLPISVIMTLSFTLGISLALACMCVFFRDVLETFMILLMPWMFLTPIFYTVDIIPQKFMPLVKLNPMFYFVEAFRAPLYLGKIPSIETLICGWAAALAALLIGYALFARYEDQFVYYV